MAATSRASPTDPVLKLRSLLSSVNHPVDHHQEQHTAAAQHDSNPEVPSPLFNVRAAAASTTASNFVKDDKSNYYNAEDNEKNHNIQNEQVNNDRNKLALLKYGDRVTLKTLHSHCHHLHLTATNNNTS